MQTADGYLPSSMVARSQVQFHGAAGAAGSDGSEASLELSATPPTSRKKARSADTRVVATRHSRVMPAHHKPRAASAWGRVNIARAPRTMPMMLAAAPPSLELPDHFFVQTTASSPNAQLAALVQQQVLDHEYMNKMGVIVRHLAMELDNGKAEAQGGRDATLLLRKELFAVRGTLSSDSISWMDSELKQALLKMQAELSKQASHKLSSLEESVAGLTASSTASTECMRRMALYLEELDGARPQEGNELVGGSRRVIHEITNVRGRVKQFEQQTMAAPAATPASTSIHAMALQLEEMQRKLFSMEEFHKLFAGRTEVSMFTIQVALQYHGRRLDDLEVHATAVEANINVLALSM